MSCEGGVEDKITGGKEGKEVRDPRVLKKGSPVWTLNSPGLVLRKIQSVSQELNTSVTELKIQPSQLEELFFF